MTEGERATKVAVLMGDGEWETDLLRHLGWILFGLVSRRSCSVREGSGTMRGLSIVVSAHPPVAASRASCEVARELRVFYLPVSFLINRQCIMPKNSPLPQEVEGAWKTWHQRVKVKQ